MTFTVHSSSPEETVKTGERLGKQLRGKEIILISGELGAGKTLLVKGIAVGLGIDPADVVSPTFVLMNVHRGAYLLFHFDLYRLGLAGIVRDPGFDDYIGEGVIAVEWAQYLSKELYAAEETIEITITLTAPEKRSIVFRTNLGYIKA